MRTSNPEMLGAVSRIVKLCIPTYPILESDIDSWNYSWVLSPIIVKVLIVAAENAPEFSGKL